MAHPWRFSRLLLLAYLAAFHFWMWVDASVRMASTIVITVTLSGLLIRAARRPDFANRWDLTFHACVILDIALEGFFVGVHDDYNFYWCALGFAAVIGGYRAYALRGGRAKPPDQRHPT